MYLIFVTKFILKNYLTKMCFNISEFPVIGNMKDLCQNVILFFKKYYGMGNIFIEGNLFEKKALS